MWWFGIPEEEPGRRYQYAWVGVVVFGALYYLTDSLLKSVVIGVFFYISSMLRIGHRWLPRLGLLIGFLGIAVALGFPHPAQWPDLIQSAPDAFHNMRAHLFNSAQ